MIKNKAQFQENSNQQPNKYLKMVILLKRMKNVDTHKFYP